ncbi:MAG: rhomboid family intramembrane serine protease, partial [Streptococcus mitis]|nr:rhomboid family intramembrane serine protease [Streptococcus mitis]
MKEIFDRRYPVTSFLLLVTALVFLLMLVTAGGNFDRADTLFRFGAMYGPAIRLFPEQIWRLFSAIFVHIDWELYKTNEFEFVKEIEGNDEVEVLKKTETI